MIAPLQASKHANTRIKADPGFQHVKDQHIAPVVAHEFVQAATEYPIVFVKNGENEQFQAVVMLGLKPEENLFCGDKWQGIYIPAAIGHYPLMLVPDAKNEGQMIVAVKEDSELLSETEGNQLYTEQGEPTEYFEMRKQKLGQYVEASQFTHHFVAHLAELGLLHTQTLTVRFNEQSVNLNGVYMVDEKKLNELDDDKFADLRKRGLLGPIYAHLTSLQQINRLAHMKAQKQA
ncbi:SapC family protein [Ferrimonas pelagia]|uniref:SapC family protein n=1 Tax=Ferrimonas pelagia TaxID=1177826 RepID=A0ABP9EB67_9GAMM